MSNQAVNIIRASAERATANGAELIGYQIAYNAESIRIKRKDLREIFESEGFGQFVPTEIDAATALSRVKSRKLPTHMIVRQFPRPNSDTPVSYGIYREHAVTGESGDSFECGARVRVDKATGLVVALPPDGGFANAECLEAAEVIAAEANDLIVYAESKDVTGKVILVVTGPLHGMAMRVRGGAYFVTMAASVTWKRLATKLNAVATGFEDVGIPLVTHPDCAHAATVAVKAGLEAKLGEVRKRIAEFSEKTRDSNVSGKIEDCEAIEAEAELYAEILGSWKDELVALVKEAKGLCLRKMAGEDADFSFTPTPETPPAPPAPPTPAAPPAPAAPTSAAAATWHAPLGALADAWGSF